MPKITRLSHFGAENVLKQIALSHYGLVKRTAMKNSIRQTEPVLNYRRAGASYTVTSREFVRQIPNITALQAVVNL